LKVLISGATGFVGSHLTDYILENHPEAEVFGLKRWRSPLDNISHCLDKIKLYDGELRDLSSLIFVLEQIKPDKIFHLAAQSYVPFSYVAPVDTLTTNIIGTTNLLEAIRITKQGPLIHICSSSEVYGQPLYTPMDEKHPTQPISPYGVSKLGEERIAWSYWKAYGMKVVITRMFTHTGARRGIVFAESNFAYQIALREKYKRDKPISVGNLKSVRTYCDVRDAVKAYWLLDRTMTGETYNIGGEDTMTVGDMLDTLFDIAGNVFETRVETDRIRPADVTLQIPDCRKFKWTTGWKPEISFEETLRSLLDYWRERV